MLRRRFLESRALQRQVRCFGRCFCFQAVHEPNLDGQIRPTGAYQVGPNMVQQMVMVRAFLVSRVVLGGGGGLSCWGLQLGRQPAVRLEQGLLLFLFLFLLLFLFLFLLLFFLLLLLSVVRHQTSMSVTVMSNSRDTVQSKGQRPVSGRGPASGT